MVNLHDERLKDPEFLERLFASLGYYNIRKKDKYLTFSRSEESRPDGISAYFNRDKVFVVDYARNIKGDLIRFIHEAHDLTIGQTVRLLEDTAGCTFTDYSIPYGDLFGGFFRNRWSEDEDDCEILDHSILKQYETIPNEKFLKDHISLKAQSYFEIGYDESRDLITIPVYSPKGDLIGVKARSNRPVEKRGNKYIYLYPCSQSDTLYGYYHNQEYLREHTVMIFEAEKSVMQAFSYGYRNAVAIGSSTLSDEQIDLIAALNPKEVWLMLDEGLHPRIIEDNLRRLKGHPFLESTKLFFWNSKGYPHKSSPCDHGKDTFEEILSFNLIPYKEGCVSENLTS